MILHIAQSNLTRNPQPHVLLQMFPLCPGVTETCRCGFRPSGTRPVLVNPNSGTQSHPVLTDCDGHSDLSVSSVQTESPYYRATVRRKAYHDDVH